MLLQFTVENFTSFRDRTSLNFVRPEGIDEHLPGFDVPGVGRVSRLVGVYGANASGKSNLLRAIDTACAFIARGTREGERIVEYLPFRLSSEHAQAPSRFELLLWLDARMYSYAIAFDGERVLEEHLSAEVDGRDLVAFERVTGVDRRTRVEVGSLLDDPLYLGQVSLPPGLGSSDFLKFIGTGVRPEQPFLAELFGRVVGRETELYAWLSRFRVFSRWLDVRPSQGWDRFDLLLLFPRQRAQAEALLRRAGTGVDALQFTCSDAALSARLRRGESLTMDELQAARSSGERFDVVFVVGNQWFSLAEVSDGTARLLELAVPWDQLVSESRSSPHCETFDELDRSLHPLICRMLLEDFAASPPDAPKQLIFSTHDISLLDPSLLGRWGTVFVEKDPRGGSHLVRLAEFKAEQLDVLEADLPVAYLEGRFGGIPVLVGRASRFLRRGA